MGLEATMDRPSQKFVLVSHVRELGGAERVLLRLGEQLRDLGISVEYVSPEGPLSEAAMKENVEVRVIPPLAKKDSNSLWTHVRRCATANLSVMRANPPQSAVYVLNAPRALVYLSPTVLRNRRRVICFAHDVYPRKSLSRFLVALAVTVGVRVVCVSDAIARSLGRRLKERVLVLHNPAYAARFSGGRPPSQKVKLGTVSNIAEWKGHLLALRALEPILNSDKDITYRIYGKVLDPAEEGYFRTLVGRLASLAGASYEGYADEPRRAMQNIDVFVHSSTRPEQPLTLAEAIAAGCAVVIPRGGGEEEVVEGWLATFTYERGDPSSFRHALNEAVASHRARGVPLSDADFDAWAAGRDPMSWARAFQEYAE
jgi:glycosyltransferase involved in cell wall biosynthesis